MPGMSFFWDSVGISPSAGSKVSSAVDPLLHDARYKKQILSDGKYYFLASTGYHEYPLTRFDSDDSLNLSGGPHL